MLLIFGGLPGTGKTTLARRVAQLRPVTYVRIDAIEHTLREAGRLPEDLGALGYEVGAALARSNLALGLPVLVDSVNPLPVTRQLWRSVAQSLNLPFLEVEIVCSDAQEHARRIATRSSDLPGLALPSWDEIQHRSYIPWSDAQLHIDTTHTAVDTGARVIIQRWRALTPRLQDSGHYYDLES